MGAVPNMDLLVVVLGCKQGFLPMKYLGLPLEAKFKDKSIWKPENFQCSFIREVVMEIWA